MKSMGDVTLKDRSELKKAIFLDNSYYFSKTKKERIWLNVTCDHIVDIKRYMKYLRYEQYFSHRSFFQRILKVYFQRKRNKLGNKLGFYICAGALEPGIVIYHHGSIVINGDAYVGSGTKLHGNNCIGNNGMENKAPVIGKNVDIGYGAIIIGDVRIADDVKIGAGAVVVSDCLIPGATLVGVPAKIVLK